MANLNYYSKLVKNQWQVFQSNQSGVVFWNTPDIVFDHGNLFSPLVSGYKIPVGGDGTYLVSFNAKFTTVGTNTDVFKVEIVHANELMATKRVISNTAYCNFAYGTAGCGTTIIDYAAEKDVFYTRIFHNAGNTGILENDSYVLSNVNSSFDIVRIKQ